MQIQAVLVTVELQNSETIRIELVSLAHLIVTSVQPLLKVLVLPVPMDIGKIVVEYANNVTQLVKHVKLVQLTV